MKKANLIIAVATVAVVAWIGISTLEVWTKNTQQNPTYSEGNVWVMVAETEATTEITETKDAVVIGCETKGDYYEVVVRTDDGNEWAYYDDCYLSNGRLLRVQFDGNEIVGAEY